MSADARNVLKLAMVNELIADYGPEAAYQVLSNLIALVKNTPRGMEPDPVAVERIFSGGVA